MKKLAIITTHPIQYYAPVFKLLTQREKIRIKVFYTWEKGAELYDAAFKQNIEWDIPLLEGYEFEFVSNGGNTARGFWDVRNPSLIRNVEAWQPDAIMVFGWNYWSHLSAMRYFKGKIPVLFRGDSTLLDEKRGLQSLLRRTFLRWIYQYVNVALYVGEHSMRYFKQHGIKEKDLVFAPHAVDNDFFIKKGMDGREAIRKKFNLSNTDVVVLFVGKLQKKKDPLLLIAAMKQLSLQSCHLLVVGSGELEEAARVLAGNAPNIHFMSFLNQSALPAVYKAADIFVLPSRGPGETWGLAVNEAMACENAIIVSNKVGCAPDLVKTDVNGYVFQSGDANDLEEKISRLVMQKGKLQQFKENSGRLIQKWKFETICDAVEKKVLGLPR